MFFYNTIIGKFCAIISPKSLEIANEKIIYGSSGISYVRKTDAGRNYDQFKNYNT